MTVTHFSTHWESCTSPEFARKEIAHIEDILVQNNLEKLLEKFRQRTLRIFEVGTGRGVFLHELINAGFDISNLGGLDQNPMHFHEYPELDSVIEPDIIQSRIKPKDEVPYDLVYSHLIFDENCYPEQGKESVRELMLNGIYDILSPGGLYYGSETHQIEEIIGSIDRIKPHAHSYIGKLKGKFIPYSSNRKIKR